jgi:hypothetical protein
MLRTERLRLRQPATRKLVVELAVWNAFGRWMHRSGWRAFTLPLPFLVIVFYWMPEPGRPDPYVRVHEFVHVRQDQRLFLFPLRYLWALVTDGGYRTNRFEREAYRIDAEARREGLPAWAAEDEDLVS